MCRYAPRMPLDANAVVVARFTDPLEAAMARGALEAAGIEAELRDAAMAGLQLGNAVGGAKLVVAPADAAHARALLAELAAGADDDEPGPFLH
jgi:putative signal transducing protein